MVFDEEFEGTFVPIASNCFEGAGVHDEKLAISGPASLVDPSPLGHDAIGFMKSLLRARLTAHIILGESSLTNSESI